MTGQPPTYEALIREVFIDPIRSVVVVDDKFPTLERLLDIAAGTGDPSSAQAVDPSWEIGKAQGIVRFCHKRQPPWLVEFHDGQPPLEQDEAIIADHLCQSDLMILDYHLDPNDPEAGTAAIEILRRIAANDHFNLVVVYTKGATDAGGDIERVWQEIAIALSMAQDALTCNPVALAAGRTLIEKLEDQDADIESKIREAVDESAYLAVREACVSGSLDWSNLLGHERLARLKAELDQFPELKQKQHRQVLRLALHERQEALRDRLSPTDIGQPRLSFDSTKVNWIRTDRLFVTVVSKQEEPSQLPGMLCQALLRWHPEPHRLLLSKVRAVLAEAGVQAEDGVLKNQHLQKAWFDDLLTAEEQDRRWKIHATVARQWEWLGDALATTAIDYANRLSALLREDAAEAAKASEHYQYLEDEAVLKHRNSYVCSKPVTGHHLTTGHILEIGNGTGTCDKWLCLSPACDLVPGQRTTGWHKRLADYLPFLAVQLYPDEKHCLGSANRGNHLFLMIGNEIACFSFTPPSKDSGERENDDAAPKWEQMFAHEQGRCGNDSAMEIARIIGNNGALTVTSSPARIIAQLRYEYALNLLHRLGATLSRVGLDFESL